MIVVAGEVTIIVDIIKSSPSQGTRSKEKVLTLSNKMSDLSRNEAFPRMAFKGEYKEMMYGPIIQISAGYDVNGDGKVSVAEFKRIMLRSGDTFLLPDNSLLQYHPGKSTHAEIEKMLQKADVDNDG